MVAASSVILYCPTPYLSFFFLMYVMIDLCGEHCTANIVCLLLLHIFISNIPCLFTTTTNNNNNNNNNAAATATTAFTASIAC